MSDSLQDRRGLLKGLIGATVAASIGASAASAQEASTRELRDIREFGAVGDGKTDDTAALQRAFDAGGVLWLSHGVFCYSSLSVKRSLILQGSGARAAVLRKLTPHGDGITIDTSQVHLRDIGFNAAVKQTGGCFVHWTERAAEVSLSNFTTDGAFVGIRSAAAYRDVVEHGSMRMAATGAGSACIVFDGGNDHYVRNITTDNPQGAMPEAGIRVECTGCINLTDLDLIHCGKDLWLHPPAKGAGVFSVFAVNCFFDTATFGLVIESGASNAVERCLFSNCWFCSHTQRGIDITGAGIIDSIQFVNCHILFNAAGGARLDAGSNLSIQNSTIAGNSAFGIQLGSAKDCRITGNKIGATGTIKGNDIGIDVTGGDGHLICHNHLRGNASATRGKFGGQCLVESNLT